MSSALVFPKDYRSDRNSPISTTANAAMPPLASGVKKEYFLFALALLLRQYLTFSKGEL
jgi:hypothetical protein